MSLMSLFKKKTKPIQVGDQAPDFTLLDKDENPVSLSQFHGRKNVILYFYPKDNTPGCIAESVHFRNQYEEFKKADAVIIGVSSDSVQSHVGFSEKYRLPFSLLSDADNKVRELYGVPPTAKLLPGRTTYLIDKKGIVQYVFSSQFRVNSHVELTLNKLKEIQ